MRILAGIITVVAVIVGAAVLWKFVLLPSLNASGGGSSGGGSGSAVNSSCKMPVNGKDEKGEWWGMAGIKYRGMTPRPASNERMCLRDGRAFWESQL